MRFSDSDQLLHEYFIDFSLTLSSEFFHNNCPGASLFRSLSAAADLATTRCPSCWRPAGSHATGDSPWEGPACPLAVGLASRAGSSTSTPPCIYALVSLRVPALCAAIAA